MKTIDSGLFPHGIFRLLRGTELGRAALHYDGSHSSSAGTTSISYFSGLVTKILDRNKGGKIVILTYSYNASYQRRNGGVLGFRSMWLAASQHYEPGSRN